MSANYFALTNPYEPDANADQRECTADSCNPFYLDSESKLCTQCGRRVCEDCRVLVGLDWYCRKHAVCGHPVQAGPTGVYECGQAAIASCHKCGNILCGEHSAKLPDDNLCVDCAREEGL